jgi:hypothetical protein
MRHPPVFEHGREALRATRETDASCVISWRLWNWFGQTCAMLCKGFCAQPRELMSSLRQLAIERFLLRQFGKQARSERILLRLWQLSRCSKSLL